MQQTQIPLLGMYFVISWSHILILLPFNRVNPLSAVLPDNAPNSECWCTSSLLASTLPGPQPSIGNVFESERRHTYETTQLAIQTVGERILRY